MYSPLALAITQDQVRLVAGIGAVVLIALAILRHKSNKKKSEADDDF